VKKLAIAAAVVLLLGAAAAAGYVLYVRHEGRDVRGSSSEEFSTTERKPPAPPPPRVAWPMYGYDPSRLRAPAGFRAIHPPYRTVWRFPAHQLLEFPPAVAYGRLYITNNSGTLYAINTRTGRLAWRFRARRCAAATPAAYRNLVFVVWLNKPPCNATRSGIDGLIAAFDARTGRIRWRHVIGPSESSPLISNGIVYVGDWRNNVYAFTATTGRLHWRFHTGDKVKGGPAIAGNRLYIGSYDSHVYALNARTGKQVWRSAAQQRLGPQGTFYAGPAVAYDRVYIGATDGKVYSFGATTGKLRWSQGTGNYVYASPAVWRGRVLVGSYDGTFYALNAATGDVLWRFDAHKPISGSASVIDGLVYFASLGGRTYALNAVTGKKVWSFGDGQYGAAVADKTHLYVVGYSSVWALAPRRG
jgi:outer membrane protein assembly factor BamB